MNEVMQQIIINKLYERIAIMDKLIDVQRQTIADRDASIERLLTQLDEAIELVKRANKLIDNRQSNSINLWK